jgi:hypothetical protein
MAVYGAQFGTGDQSDWKRQFWKSGFATCPQCAKTDIDKKGHGAGCRQNGDGYGTEVFTCKGCGWKTSFQYDDAAESYYYETREYRQEEERAKERAMLPKDLPMSEAFRMKFRAMLRRNMDKMLVEAAMEDEGIATDAIDSFLKAEERARERATAALDQEQDQSHHPYPTTMMMEEWETKYRDMLRRNEDESFVRGAMAVDGIELAAINNFIEVETAKIKKEKNCTCS